AGDIFQLGNTAYRIRRVERGTVRVEDAAGQPPSVPFWLGEAPGRSDELSLSVSRLRTEIAARLPQKTLSALQGREGAAPGLDPGEAGGGGLAGGRSGSPHLPRALPAPRGGGREEGAALSWLPQEVGLDDAAARQLVESLAAAHAALGPLPSHDR